MHKRCTSCFILLLIIASLLNSGCATVSTLQVASGDGACYELCGWTPYIYGGSLNALRRLTLSCHVSGERGLGYLVTYPLFFPLYVVDVPLSLAADTLISPYTLYQQMTIGSICIAGR